MLNLVNFTDDGGCPLAAYFGIGFSKPHRHSVLYLPTPATKSLMLNQLSASFVLI